MNVSICQYFMKNLSVYEFLHSHSKTQHDQIDFLCDLLNANTTPEVPSLSSFHPQRFFRVYCFRLKPLIDFWITELNLTEFSSTFNTLFSDVAKLSIQDMNNIESFLTLLKENMEIAITERAQQIIQLIQRENSVLFGGYFARRLQLLVNKKSFSIPELHELNMIYSTLQKHNQDYKELYLVCSLLFFHVDTK